MPDTKPMSEERQVLFAKRTAGCHDLTHHEADELLDEIDRLKEREGVLVGLLKDVCGLSLHVGDNFECRECGQLLASDGHHSKCLFQKAKEACEG